MLPRLAGLAVKPPATVPITIKPSANLLLLCLLLSALPSLY